MFSVCLTYVCSILFSVVSLYLFHHVFSFCLCLFHHVFSCFFFPPPYVCSIMFVVCLPMFVPSWFQFFPDVCSIMCLFPYVCSIMFSFFCPMFVPSCCQFFFPYVCSIMFSYVFSLRLFHHVFSPRCLFHHVFSFFPMFVPSCFHLFSLCVFHHVTTCFPMFVPSCFQLCSYVCSIMFSVCFPMCVHHVFSVFVPYVCSIMFFCLHWFHHVFSCSHVFPYVCSMILAEWPSHGFPWPQLSPGLSGHRPAAWGAAGWRGDWYGGRDVSPWEVGIFLAKKCVFFCLYVFLIGFQ